MPEVRIPPSLRRITGGRKQLHVDGKSVRAVIEAIDREHPGFQERVCMDGKLKPGIAVAVGSRISDMGLHERLEADDELHFVMSISGG